MSSVGILAYGSLINNPGKEIKPLIVNRIDTMTPFPVEFVRYSGKTRGGAPTVAPHSSGISVKAEILVLSEKTSLEEARNLLWRRETRNECSGKTYNESTSKNATVIRDVPFCGFDHVLYTDFNPSGKIKYPDPQELGRAAVESVAKAERDKDGISYLMDLINSGVVTELTARYQEEILVLTGASSLIEALRMVRSIHA